jgi:hypothetical protein
MFRSILAKESLLVLAGKKEPFKSSILTNSNQVYTMIYNSTIDLSIVGLKENSSVTALSTNGWINVQISGLVINFQFLLILLWMI